MFNRLRGIGRVEQDFSLKSEKNRFSFVTMVKIQFDDQGRRHIALACKVCGQPITSLARANVLYRPRDGNQCESDIVGVIHDECECGSTRPLNWWKLDEVLRSVRDELAG